MKYRNVSWFFQTSSRQETYSRDRKQLILSAHVRITKMQKKVRKLSRKGLLKLIGLHRDHPPANRASVEVI